MDPSALREIHEILPNEGEMSSRLATIDACPVFVSRALASTTAFHLARCIGCDEDTVDHACSRSATARSVWALLRDLSRAACQG